MEVVAEHPTLMGLNVTIPYKEQVLPYLDDIDSEAQNIGAVNVIKIIRKKNNLQFKGYNSDVIGFSDSLRPLLTPERNKALVLGTGGAAKAISYGLNKLGVSPTYVSRKPKEGQLTYDDLTPEIMAEYKVIVNTTPLGMYPHVDECPNIPYEFLSPAHLCYDLIYNPDTTLFMKKAATYGAEVKNGLEMLLLQAFVSWKIWNDL
jgi:shikimate dehydrogenase